MSFLKKLFGLGGGSTEPGPPRTLKQVEHKGFVIEAQPYADGGQFQLAGRITKSISGEVKEHRFVRADRFSSIEDAADFTLIKGQQMIDQMGDRLFT